MIIQICNISMFHYHIHIFFRILWRCDDVLSHNWVHQTYMYLLSIIIWIYQVGVCGMHHIQSYSFLIAYFGNHLFTSYESRRAPAAVLRYNWCDSCLQVKHSTHLVCLRRFIILRDSSNFPLMFYRVTTCHMCDFGCIAVMCTIRKYS